MRFRFLNLNKWIKHNSLLGTYSSHILRTWAAERLAAPLPTHCGSKLNLQNYLLFCSGHMEPSEIGIFLNKSWRPQLRDQTNASLYTTGFFLHLQRRDGHDAILMQSWYSVLRLSGTSMLGIPWNGFPRKTCRKKKKRLEVRHVLRTWAAERLAAPLPTHCC